MIRIMVSLSFGLHRFRCANPTMIYVKKIHDQSNLSSTLHVTITESFAMVEPCEILVGAFIPPMLNISCQSLSHEITVLCPATKSSSCFSIIEAPESSSNASLDIQLHSCVFVRSAITVNAVNTTVTIDRTIIDATNTHVPINVFTAWIVFITNTQVERGYSTSLWMGGGCISLRGVKKQVFVRNVLVQNCFSARFGGCLLISGDTSQDIERRYMASSFYSGSVDIIGSVFRNCNATTTGLVNVAYVRSLNIQNSSFLGGFVRQFEGCLGIMYVYPGKVVLENNVVRDCLAKEESDGCVGIATFDEFDWYPEFNQYLPRPGFVDSEAVVVRNLTLTNCVSSGDTGGMSIVNTTRSVTLDGIVIQQGVCRDRGAGFKFQSLNAVSVRNVMIRDVKSKSVGGAITVYDTPNFMARNISIFGSQARLGGALFVVNSTVFLQNVFIQDSRSMYAAYCVMIQATNITFQNVTILCRDVNESTFSRRYRFRQLATFAINSTPWIGEGPWVGEKQFATSSTTVTASLRNATKATRQLNSFQGWRTSEQNVVVGTSVAIQTIGVMSPETDAATVLTSAWLGMLMYDCNQYKPSSLEMWFDPDFYGSSSPRVLNLYVNGAMFSILILVEIVATVISLCRAGVRYANVTHPRLTLRGFLFFVFDLSAASCCCFVVEQIALGVSSTLGIVGISIFIYFMYFRKLGDVALISQCYAAKNHAMIQPRWLRFVARVGEWCDDR
eukprot:PhF_6_TR29391/c0_g1_i3/m.43347